MLKLSTLKPFSTTLLTTCTFLVSNCGDNDNQKDDSTTEKTPINQAVNPDTNAVPNQVPVSTTAQGLPQLDAASIKAWLDAGTYKTWNCEPAPHAQRGSSPHGSNRICTNNTLTEAASGDSQFPINSGAVKELYNGTTLSGYAVAIRGKTIAGGSGWYWYEILGGNTVVSSYGDSGTAKNVCVGCHSKAPKDQVFTIVRKNG